MKRSALKNTPQLRAAICKLVALGLSVNRAAGKVKVHHSTVAEWRRNDPEFDAAVQNAEAAFIEKQIKIIEDAAKKGTWTAAAWLLERKFASEFSQPHVQLHMHGGAVVFEDYQAMMSRVNDSPEAKRLLGAAERVVEAIEVKSAPCPTARPAHREPVE